MRLLAYERSLTRHLNSKTTMYSTSHANYHKPVYSSVSLIDPVDSDFRGGFGGSSLLGTWLCETSWEAAVGV